LRDLLREKRVLVILDDVWRREDVDGFDILGPCCRAMMSTRDSGRLTSLGGVHHMVELLTDQEALNLLAQRALPALSGTPQDPEVLSWLCFKDLYRWPSARNAH
jgi:NB-ARC domain